MPHLEHLMRLWRALDAPFERVEPTWWGAVVTDSRFPTIWDVNYARVETDRSDLSLAEVEEALRPALAESGAAHVHLVLFHPEELTGLLSEAGTRGDRLSWDTVMEHRAERHRPASASAASSGGAVAVEEVRMFDEVYWRRHRESLLHFDVHDEPALDELVRLEREVMLPAGKRWFAVREASEMVAFGSLLLLEGVGYVDGVVTFPEARGKGYASAIVGRIVAESLAAGAERTYLLAEPNGRPLRLYERLGFVRVGDLGSTLRPIG